MRISRSLPLLLAALSIVPVTNAAAQPLGIFRWQLAPYCNVLTLLPTANGPVYRLEGFDDQCGGARASAVGMAVENPNGTIEFGLTVVTAPGGASVHIDVVLDPATFSGTWEDDAGGAGTLIFNPAVPTGSPRPAPILNIPDAAVTAAKIAPGAVDGARVLDGSIGAADVVVTEIQRRISAACPTGQFMRGVNQDGTVTCDVGGGNGDITAVAAGAGLSGGGVIGDVALAVNFAGAGVAATAARSDHTHAATGSGNTAVGQQALAALTTGSVNTAVGDSALFSQTTGHYNVALGGSALYSNTAGNSNLAAGFRALVDLTTGNQNVAIGTNAAMSTTSGSSNVAVGHLALPSNLTGTGNVAIGQIALVNSTGHENIAIGPGAGFFLTTGDHNLYLGHPGVANESGTMRLGEPLAHVRTFIEGVRGVTTGVNDAVPVLIDSAGQMGTVSSSRRYKEDITDMASTSSAILQLRPVTFRYRERSVNGDKPIQFGLIAEEVAEVMPSLAVLNKDGRPETVKYHEIPVLLLNEVQRLEREKEALEAQVSAQGADLGELRRQVADLLAAVQRLTSAKR